MATFTIVNDTDGTFRVHRAGCADITRRAQRRGINGNFDVVAATARNAVDVTRLDLRESGFGDDADDFEFIILPCALYAYKYQGETDAERAEREAQ